MTDRVRAASTVVVMRPGVRPGSADAEVLLTHRPATMAFGPGIHVFPGGAVDPGDGAPDLAHRSVLSARECAAGWAGDLAPAAALAHAVAAIRELFEEVGLLLATHADGTTLDAAVVESAHRAGEPLASLADRLDLRLRTDRLVPISHWVTPPLVAPRRYDTRFFAADALDGSGFRLDEREVAAHDWMSPRDAIDACRAGRLELWAATASTLHEIGTAADAAAVRASLAPVRPWRPPEVDAVAPGIVRVRTHGAGGLPGRTACTYLVGRARVVVVDPGDPSLEAAELVRTLVAAGGGSLAGVALTAPAPERAAGVAGLALVPPVPVLSATDAACEMWEPMRALHDGENVDIGDVPLRVLAMPGSSPWHLAFDVPSAGCVLMGDVDGGASADGSRAVLGALGPRRRLGARV